MSTSCQSPREVSPAEIGERPTWTGGSAPQEPASLLGHSHKGSRLYWPGFVLSHPIAPPWHIPRGTCTSGGQNDNLLLREGTRFKLCSKKLQPPVICRLEATKCSKRSIGKVSNPTNWPRILVNLQDSWDGWQVKTCEANRPTLHSDIWILTHLLNGPQA